MSIGFPVSGADGNGTSASDMRKIVSSHWASLGVISGAGVSTSSSGLTYAVAAGTAVASRGTSYGAVEFLVPAGTITTDAGPASGSRLDVVWAKPNDPSQGDANADVVLGVTKGAVASAPSKPAIPTGAVELRTFLVPQGATKTSQAGVSGWAPQAVSQGGALGVIHQDLDTWNTHGDPAARIMGNGSFNLDTRSQIVFEIFSCISGKDGGDGSVVYEFILDGQVIGATERSYHQWWDTSTFTVVRNVDAGAHSVAYRRRNWQGNGFVQHYGLSGPDDDPDGPKFMYSGTWFGVRHLGVAR